MGQINPSKIAWICLVSFVRIGAFQWVTTIPNKNLFLSHIVYNMSSTRVSPALFFASSNAEHAPRVGFGDWTKVTRILLFEKEMLLRNLWMALFIAAR
jgi:hypothetical protein